MKLESFDFEEGKIINGKYEILEKLGDGWEGEVYLASELRTGVERTLKFFYPHRNLKNKTSKFYARKLHKLRGCDIVIQYQVNDEVFIEGHMVTFLVSEFIEGELLSDFLKRQPGKKLPWFTALHLLHDLAKGMACIHRLKEYHGDLHSENIIVQRSGLGFDLKILDFYHWGRPSSEHIKDDVVDIIQIFYDSLGGKKSYNKLPKEVKSIICGLKKSLIWKKYKTASKLKEYLETLEWE